MQQQHPQGVQQMQQPGVAAPGGMVGTIHAKLSSAVAVNQLQRFYPPQALQALASRLDGRVNFRDLAARCAAQEVVASAMAATTRLEGPQYAQLALAQCKHCRMRWPLLDASTLFV
jgi:hypothetical protein